MTVCRRRALSAITAFCWLAVPVAAAAQNPNASVRTFMESGTFTVPAGVTSIVIELWGGGGGGGGGASASVASGPGGGGGGGGAGAYVRATLTVPPGERYAIEIGQGGRGGPGEQKRSAEPGLKGGDTVIRSDGRDPLVASGGQGGQAPTFGSSNGGKGGAGGAPAAPPPTVTIRPGAAGASGLDGGNPDLGPSFGGGGGLPAAASPAASVATGGVGGAGEFFGHAGGTGLSGRAGAATISW